MQQLMTKLETLQAAYADSSELELVFDKLIGGKLSEQRLKLARYDRDLAQFEQQYGMSSSEFYRRFESGDLGDAMDFFEWSGLWELRQRLAGQINQLERSLDL